MSPVYGVRGCVVSGMKSYFGHGMKGCVISETKGCVLLVGMKGASQLPTCRNLVSLDSR